jgi:Flp pilus assembly protein TadG
MLLRPPAHPTRRRAAAAVEFAVVVPVLLLFVMGTVECGRLLMVSQVVTSGSREGARYAVQADATVADVDHYVRTYLTQAGLPATAISSLQVEYQVTNTDGGDAAQNQGWVAASTLATLKAGTAVRVKVVIDFEAVNWLPTTVFVSKGSRVTGVTVMRKE